MLTPPVVPLRVNVGLVNPLANWTTPPDRPLPKVRVPTLKTLLAPRFSVEATTPLDVLKLPTLRFAAVTVLLPAGRVTAVAPAAPEAVDSPLTTETVPVLLL